MQAFVAETVHAFIHGGLTLRDRLEMEESFDWRRERAKLTELLAPFGVEDDMELDLVFAEDGSMPACGPMTRAAIYHALVGWLNEWLTRYLPDRPGLKLLEDDSSIAKFWEEARYAETRGDLEALEIMHLCVMLGFRGSMIDQPDRLEAWVARINKKLEHSVSNLAMPINLAVPHAPARRNRRSSLRKLAFSTLLTAALALPAIVVWMCKY